MDLIDWKLSLAIGIDALLLGDGLMLIGTHTSMVFHMNMILGTIKR